MNAARGQQESAQGHSLITILHLIRDQSPISRIDITEILGLASSTVSVATAQLTARGLVRECGYATSTGGRRPVLLELNPAGGHFICVDLANTHLSLAVMDIGYNQVHELSRLLPVAGGDALFQTVLEALMEAAAWCEAEDRPVLGIGIATPGLVDSESGIVVEADNLNWHEFALRDKLAPRFSHPIIVLHDTLAAAYGEYLFGDPLHGPKAKNVMYVHVGHGVGAGMVLNGSLYSGGSGMAGELGHVVINPSGPICVCGNRGCLETVASHAGVVNAYRRALYEIRADYDLSGVGLEEIVSGAETGDRAAIRAIREAGFAVGLAIGNQVNVLNLDSVWLEGTLTHNQIFWDEASAILERVLVPKLRGTCTMSPSALGSRAGLMGIAAISLEHVL